MVPRTAIALVAMNQGLNQGDPLSRFVRAMELEDASGLGIFLTSEGDPTGILTVEILDLQQLEVVELFDLVIGSRALEHSHDHQCIGEQVQVARNDLLGILLIAYDDRYAREYNDNDQTVMIMVMTKIKYQDDLDRAIANGLSFAFNELWQLLVVSRNQYLGARGRSRPVSCEARSWCSVDRYNARYGTFWISRKRARLSACAKELEVKRLVSCMMAKAARRS